MSTVGVNPFSNDRILPLDMPGHQYSHPSGQTYQLSTVKEDVFHPQLPTWRRMEMDSLCGKLSNEHCRYTTSCSLGILLIFLLNLVDVHDLITQILYHLLGPKSFSILEVRLVLVS